ncbi:MAG: PIN domain-containing protein [Pirellulaceae bacterium]
MILVDTTVVVAYLRSGEARLLSAFAAHNAAICGVTRAEILHGIRQPADHPRFVAALDAFAQVSLPEGLWDQTGLHLAALRRAGISMPLADVIIATLAMHLDVELWSRDQHHLMLQSAVPQLRLFEEPP